MTPQSGQKAARRGFASEDRFIHLVNSDVRFNESLKAIMGLSHQQLKAEKPENKKVKADASLVSLPNTYKGGSGVKDPGEVFNQCKKGCSIKEAEADFNQLERVWLADLAADIQMPESVQKVIQRSLDDRRLKRSKIFITEDAFRSVKEFFEENREMLLRRLFADGDNTLEYFIVHDFSRDTWHITALTNVIEFLKLQPLSVSPKGVLYFGRCMTMQRKGGNGAHIAIPKSDPKHPGNQLQFKIKPLSILSNVRFALIQNG